LTRNARIGLAIGVVLLTFALLVGSQGHYTRLARLFLSNLLRQVF